MTDKQGRWLSEVIRKYEQEAEKRYPMEDSDWEELQKSVSIFYNKSGKNPEVKDALVKMLVRCDKRDRSERGIGRRGICHVELSDVYRK